MLPYLGQTASVFKTFCLGILDGFSRGSDSNLNNHSTSGGFGIDEDGIQGSRQDVSPRSGQSSNSGPHVNDRRFFFPINFTTFWLTRFEKCSINNISYFSSVEALQFQLHNANSRLEEMTTRYMFLERMVNDQVREKRKNHPAWTIPDLQLCPQKWFFTVPIF